MFDESKVTKLLNWAYQKSLEGVPGAPSARELGESYLQKHGDPELAIDKLIAWQVAECSATGFVTGLGGALTLPVAIPADLATTYYIMIRMVAAIAHIRGFNLSEESTRTLVFLTLIGDSIEDIAEEAKVDLRTQAVEFQMRKVSQEILRKLNKTVSRQLATKTGKRGFLRFTKAVPLAGGIIGGTINGFSCRTVGKFAKENLRHDRAPVEREARPV